jgi:N-methylhydantoinase A
MLKLGIDTGGTFTDFVLHDGKGIRTLKVPSTPQDPAQAIVDGLARLFTILPETLEIIHGSTVATNAFLERKGARTVLITTWGFEDVLFIGRQNRPRLYDLFVERPAEIIPYSQVIGVKERVLFDGTVQKPLGKTFGRRLRRLCRHLGAESVVVCLLHSYANDCHERRIKEELASLNIPIILSSEILPEFREYERLCTTLINGYLAPVVASYIDRLAAAVGSVPLFIQQSNGGILPAADIGRRAVYTVLSGPAGGVHGAAHLARQMNISRIITFDMGGTSTDVAVCDPAPVLTRDYRIDDYPIRIPMMDIHTVGAGGGSLAWIDSGGILRVGPESAGADPGPVCYGRGDRLTVTDANLFLGRLLPDYFLGGAMQLHPKNVDDHLSALARRLDMSGPEVARGIIRIVNASMTKAIRAVTLERGHDPKDFTLVAFGGASGLHCCELAQELGINRIVVPARAGILSAQGMVFSDYTLDRMESLFLAGPALTAARLHDAFRDLEQKTCQEFAAICRGRNMETLGRLTVNRYLNLRYQGQSHELCVEFFDDFAEHFHELHNYTYGHRMDDVGLELISIQCVVKLVRPKEALPQIPATGPTTAKPDNTLRVQLTAGIRDVGVFRRHALRPGHVLIGPALVADDYATVLLTEDFELRVDSLLNLIIEPQK